MTKFIGRFVALAVAVPALCVPAGGALAQEYPSRPIRLVTPNAPGGMTDVLARLVAHKITESWGQPVIVDNRGGGGGVIGTNIVANASPNGYTLLVAPPSFVVNPTLRKNLPYDTEKGFAPVTRMAFSPSLLVVHPSLAVKSVDELITYAKAHPGQIRYGSGGIGNGGHLSGELVKRLAGIDMVHIPYRGVGPGVTALLAGEVSLTFAQLPIVRPHVESGRLLALAVTSPVRSKVMPDLPTVAESLPGYKKPDAWFGIIAPAGTPKGIISRLNSEIRKIMRMPDVSGWLLTIGAEPATNTPEEFAAFIRAEIKQTADIISKSGAHVD